jgi:hypothetical protein
MILARACLVAFLVAAAATAGDLPRRDPAAAASWRGHSPTRRCPAASSASGGATASPS